MEHIVQFAIGIDDDAIKKRIEQNAEHSIISQLQNDIKQSFFGSSRYGYSNNPTPAPFIMERFESFLDDNKDDILEMTSNKLAEKLARSKRGKEILEHI